MYKLLPILLFVFGIASSNNYDNIIQSDIFYGDILLKKGGIMILDDTQLKCIEDSIPQLLSRGYSFAYQIPTFGFSHVCLVKPSD